MIGRDAVEGDAAMVAAVAVEEAAAGIAAARATLERSRAERGVKAIKAEAWDMMGFGLRGYMVTMATTREEAGKGAMLPWSAFSGPEQAAIGAMARELQRQLRLAQWLR